MLDKKTKDKITSATASHVAQIPHFFRHACDLLHLPTYEEAFREERLLTAWERAPRQDLEFLVHLFGYQKGQKIREKKQEIAVEDKILLMLHQLSQCTQGMEISFENLIDETWDSGPSWIIVDLFFDSTCYAPPLSGSLSRKPLRQFFLSKISTNEQIFDTRRENHLNTQLDSCAHPSRINSSKFDSFFSLVDQRSREQRWIPLLEVPFIDVISHLAPYRKVVFFCNSGSDSSSAALYMRMQRTKIFSNIHNPSSTSSESSSHPLPDFFFVRGGVRNLLME